METALSRTLMLSVYPLHRLALVFGNFWKLALMLNVGTCTQPRSSIVGHLTRPLPYPTPLTASKGPRMQSQTPGGAPGAATPASGPGGGAGTNLQQLKAEDPSFATLSTPSGGKEGVPRAPAKGSTRTPSGRCYHIGTNFLQGGFLAFEALNLYLTVFHVNTVHLPPLLRPALVGIADPLCIACFAVNTSAPIACGIPYDKSFTDETTTLVTLGKVASCHRRWSSAAGPLKAGRSEIRRSCLCHPAD